ncbi:MAG: polyprenyl synthetase family protein [Bacteroidota bacterium]
MNPIKELQQQIESGISQLHFGDQPKELYEPISYILSLGGKRLRPLLVLLGYRLFKEDTQSIVRSALAVEVFHNFTLMHDDIMDEAPLRRGQPTVHEKWDNTVAILSGDTMLVKAYDLLLDLDDNLLAEGIRIFNKTAVEVCEGQQIDMNFEKASTVTEGEYIEMIRLKTAVLLGFSLQFGALMAQASSKHQESLYRIGELMGIGFQLMDDLLDVYGDQKKFGKQVGGDIVSNKKTFLLIKALELANENQKELLDDWLTRVSFEPEEKVIAVRDIYDQLNIKAITEEKINSYFDQSVQLIDQLDVDTSLLKTFTLQLMKRES